MLTDAKLYSYWRSSCSWRARIGLALVEQSYEYVAVNLLQSEQRAEPYVEVNTLAQVPTLEWSEDGETRRLTQSMAILQCLDTLGHTPLIPRDRWAAARAWQLAEIVNAGIQPLQNLFVLKAIESFGQDRKAWGHDAIERGFVAMEARAQESAGRFLVGDAPSIADVVLVPQLYNARRFDVDLSRFGTLTRIEESCVALEAFQSAHPDRQPDAVL